MARINISISDDLKQQMDSFPKVNWSSVAQDAFETQVKINQLKETDMQAAGIERLRVSKQSKAERELAEGFALGKRWALEHADYDELERVADLVETAELAEVNGYHLVQAVNNDDKPGRRDIQETLDSLVGCEQPSDSLVEGFIEGAAEVFNEV